RGRGLAREMMQLAEDLTLGRGLTSVRVDTHADNAAMRGLLEKRGYTPCGTVWYRGGTGADQERVAYEKILV
ncbi:MAG: GNAT family N-acetyltransferase, partial [Oscillospiraceae bacterium]|nr:GNAT family N-acetyltransferase [Oscillospiraceae bacterium]